MKKILITGANSYIGTSFGNWVAQWPDKYSVGTINMINNTWKEEDFSRYEVVFHVAGIAHIKETKGNAELYYEVNRDLAFETANKAKAEGVKQFVFLSSMSVYGLEKGVINKNTPFMPDSNYGKSKLQAEELIKTLEDSNFKIAILRPPMIYGKGCRGNYPRLVKLAVKTPIFPDIDNKRSMIYIDNLCEFVRLLIDDRREGLFCPQNKEYVSTKTMIKLIAESKGQRIKFIPVFNWLINKMIGKFKLVTKLFGTLIYEKDLSTYDQLNYNVCDFVESIKKS